LNRQPSGAAVRWGYVTAAAVVYFVLNLIILHILRPDYDPTRRFISEYAVGPYGGLMTSAFYVLGMGSLALVPGLYRGVALPGRSLPGLALLAIWSIGVILVGFYPTDLQEGPATQVGVIHNQSATIAFESITVAMILFSIRFRRDDRWQHYARPSLALGVMALIALAAIIYLFFPLGVPGLGQRLFLAAVLSWLFITAVRLRFVSDAP
jgi:hypothetical membrane protein